MLSENGAADGPSGRVAPAGTAVDGDDFALMGFNGIEDFFESIRGVSVVDNNGEGLACIDNIHAALDASEGFDTLFNLGVSEAEFFAHQASGEGIQDIKFAGDFGLYIYITR